MFIGSPIKICRLKGLRCFSLLHFSLFLLRVRYFSPRRDFQSFNSANHRRDISRISCCKAHRRFQLIHREFTVSAIKSNYAGKLPVLNRHRHFPWVRRARLWYFICRRVRIIFERGTNKNGWRSTLISPRWYRNVKNKWTHRRGRGARERWKCTRCTLSI